MSTEPVSKNSLSPDPSLRARRDVAIGFAALFIYAGLGLLLEGLHAFKVGLYVDQNHATRRFLMTLAHAHGGVLSLFQIAYGVAASRLAELSTPLLSSAYRVALALVPLGFFLGALGATAADPGPFVLLVPAGAFALLYALLLTAYKLFRSPPTIEG